MCGLRTVACLSFLMALAGAAQLGQLPAATDAYGGFGLPDPRGGRLLLAESQGDRDRALGNAAPTLARPELLKTALCAGGRRVAIQFERRQVETANDGRQAPRNFEKLAGSVFAVRDTAIDAGAPCCPSGPRTGATASWRS